VARLADGARSAREKSLIALAVAHAVQLRDAQPGDLARDLRRTWPGAIASKSSGSLPHHGATNTDTQRGASVHEKSIAAPEAAERCIE